jgi:aspartate aminotransferase-like enzyme
MGYSSLPENVTKLLAALEELLAEQKVSVERGTAVAAAKNLLI